MSPYFWKFVFPNKQKNKEVIITSLHDSNSELGAIICLRIVFKVFEMNIKLITTRINLADGYIRESQTKIDKMSEWVKTPEAYKVTKVCSYYKLGSKSEFKGCIQCLSVRGRAQCKFRICIIWCASHVLSGETRDKCKAKTR